MKLPAASDVGSVMGSNSYYADLVSLRTVAPEDSVRGGSPIFRVGFENFFSKNTAEGCELMDMQGGMAGLLLQKRKSLPYGLQAFFHTGINFQLPVVLNSLFGEFKFKIQFGTPRSSCSLSCSTEKRFLRRLKSVILKNCRDRAGSRRKAGGGHFAPFPGPRDFHTARTL